MPPVGESAAGPANDASNPRIDENKPRIDVNKPRMAGVGAGGDYMPEYECRPDPNRLMPTKLKRNVL
jgi:hypothetical protein